MWRKRRLPTLFGGNISWYSHYAEKYGGALWNQKQSYHVIQQSHSWTYIQRNPWFEHAAHCSLLQLFTIAKTWKQPKCPLTDGYIKKVWCMHTMEYYLAFKKNEAMPYAATWMDLGIITLQVKKIRERQISYYMAYMWSLKKWYKWTYLQNGNRLIDLEYGLVVSRVEGWVGGGGID